MTTCRSCGAQIFWATTAAGKAMPIDAEPNPAGNVVVERVDGRLGARVLSSTDVGPRTRYTSHFATCPNAGAHRSR